jgi:hypothetical protein
MAPPSEKQLSFLEHLAWKAQRTVPEGARQSRVACSQLIDELNAVQVPLPYTMAPNSGMGQWDATQPSAHGIGPPTQRQLAFADELARQRGMMVPEGARRSFQECKQFIEDSKAIMPPSVRQLGLAQDLALQAGRTLPEGARRSSSVCSQFIDEMLAMVPPSEKQLRLAEDLAWKAQRTVPEGAHRSRQRSPRLQWHKGHIGNRPHC